MTFGTGSLARRIALFSLVLAGLIATSVYYTQRLVATSSQRSLGSISESQQIQSELNNLRATLLSMERAVYQYSFFQDGLQQERLLTLSNSVVFQANRLLNTPVSQKSGVIRQVIQTIDDDLARLQSETRNLLRVMSSAGTFYPGMHILTDKLYPTNVEFMQAVELAILEAENSIRRPGQREILDLLKEAKYAWVQQISSVRVFIANRAGAFGEPRKSMELNENNRRMYSDLVKLQLQKLEKFETRRQIGIQQADSLRQMAQALENYETNFQEAAKIYLSENWRADIPIMRDVIRPLLDQVWLDINAIDVELQKRADGNIVELVDTASTLSRFIWAFGVFGFLVLFAGYLLFEFVIRRPIMQVANALDAFCQDMSYTPVIRYDTQETRALVSAFQRMQQHVDSRQKRLESILDNAGEGIITINEERRIETFNNSAETLFGYRAADTVGQDIHFLLGNVTAEENADFVRRIMGADPLKGAMRFSTTVSAKRQNGDVFPLSVNLSELRTDGRQLFIAIVEDISERQAMIHHLKHLAEHDSLTGLYNRQYFMEELDRVVNRASRRGGNIQYALLYIDLDNFKFVNDTLGHIAGDKVLVEVTSILRKRLRKSDLLARLGGDEFGVLLYEVDEDQAEHAAQFYKQQLAEYTFKYEGKAIDIGCSIGVAMFTPDVQSKEDLSARADIACHIAKRTGRNSVHVYEPDDKANMASMYADMGWARRIKKAIEADNFVLACQPIAQTTSLEVSSYEVLLRMRDENDLFVMPAGFLPSAERFGLMLDIDRWVVRRAIAALAHLRRDNPRLRYSVNLSAKAVCDAGILAVIKEEFGRHAIDPAALTFEITENVAIGNMSIAVEFLEQLRALGCFTALDDFGVGYSSFAYLKDLPVDFVKIDGSFVKDIETNALHRAMVKSMNEVAHAIGKQTVAEFVENAQSLLMLREIGVDFVQGYHIGKPLIVELPVPGQGAVASAR